tara:strand:+ start:813 stop:2108 length:1296 start_codon:yes stop_codon:yes gene_type:complete
MKILLLSIRNINGNHKNIRGTENIVKIISDEFKKKGNYVEILNYQENKEINLNEKDNVINFFSRGKLNDPTYFKEKLREIKPDLVQFHGFTEEWGFSHLVACKELNIKTVLWHNVPSITCMQHELLYMSKDPCNGKFSLKKCTACRLNRSIKNKLISNIFGTIGNFPIEFINYKKLNRLLSSRKYSYEFKNSIQLMINYFDIVLCGAEWVKKVLLINNFDKDKLVLVRPSLTNEFWDLYNDKKPYNYKEKFSYKSENINLLFWGRLIDSKGMNVIRKTIKLLGNYKYTIHIVGDINSGDQTFKKLYSENKNNRKIIFHGVLDQTSIFKLGRKCDLALLPSSWFETGPITVYEAFAMNLPIIGTKLGGIEEICSHQFNSLLFELNNHKALANLIISVIKEPKKIDYLRSNLPLPRSPRDLAKELKRVYEGLF